jgi:hypothetical protein
MANMSTPARSNTNAARICTILGFVFAVVAIFIFPPLFGLIGLVLGLVGGFLGDKPLGWYAAAAAVVGAIIGMLIGAAIFS